MNDLTIERRRKTKKLTAEFLGKLRNELQGVASIRKTARKLNVSTNVVVRGAKFHTYKLQVLKELKEQYMPKRVSFGQWFSQHGVEWPHDRPI